MFCYIKKSPSITNTKNELCYAVHIWLKPTIYICVEVCVCVYVCSCLCVCVDAVFSCSWIHHSIGCLCMILILFMQTLFKVVAVYWIAIHSMSTRTYLANTNTQIRTKQKHTFTHAPLHICVAAGRSLISDTGRIAAPNSPTIGRQPESRATRACWPTAARCNLVRPESPPPECTSNGPRCRWWTWIAHHIYEWKRMFVSLILVLFISCTVWNSQYWRSLTEFQYLHILIGIVNHRRITHPFQPRRKVRRQVAYR